MKQRYLWVGVAGVLLSWIFNLVYFDAKQLDEPIFLDHYYEVDLSREGSVEFYYLVNKTDPHEVSWVSFDEGLVLLTAGDVWDIGWMMEEEEPLAYNAEYTHYYLKSFRVDWEQATEVLQDSKVQDALYEKIQVGLDDGTVMEADIGEVRFYWGEEEAKQGPWEFVSGSASFDGENLRVMKGLEDVQIDSLSHSLPDHLVKGLFIHPDLDYEEFTDGPDPTNPDEEPFPGFMPWEKTEKPLLIKNDKTLGVKFDFALGLPVYVRANVMIEGSTSKGVPFRERMRIQLFSLEEEQLSDLIQEKESRRKE